MAKDTDNIVGDAAFGANRLPPRFAPRPAISSADNTRAGDTVVADAAALGKHWSQSMTVWAGAIGPVLMTFGPPVLSALTGVPISQETARIFGEQALQLAQQASVVAGAGFVLWGRARAAGPLERRQVTVRV